MLYTTSQLCWIMLASASILLCSQWPIGCQTISFISTPNEMWKKSVFWQSSKNLGHWIHTHTHTHHSSLSQFSHKVEYLLPGLIYLGLGMTKMTLKCLFLSISVQLVSVLYFPEVQQHLIWILKISYRFLVCTFCYIDITVGEWLLGIYILPSCQCHCSFFDSLVSIIW